MERHAFTLIELLTVMVVVSLLVALLIPALARAKEEDRLVDCRANLMQIGKAVTMYANDNGGWSPMFASVFWLNDNNPYFRIDGKVATRTCWEFWSAKPPKPGYFGSFDNNVALTMNHVMVGRPQPWNVSARKPAMGVGLGLLWTGGYLAGKGAAVFYCPGAASAPLAKEKGYDKRVQYDADEPFWTSKGRVARADGDATGDCASSAFPACTEDGLQPINRGLCNVLSNYSARFASRFATFSRAPERSHPYAINLKEIGDVGLWADNIDLLVFSAGVKWWGLGTKRPPFEDLMKYAEENGHAPRVVRNHETAWNVLFADGSVKTYTDDGKKIYAALHEAYWHVEGVYGGFNLPIYRENAPEQSAEGLIWGALLDKAQ